MKKVLATSVIAVLCIASVFALDFNFGAKPVDKVCYSFDVSASISRLDVDFGVAVDKDEIGSGFGFESLNPEGYVLYNFIKSDDFKFGAGLLATGTEENNVNLNAMTKVSYKVAKMTSLFAYTYTPVAALNFSDTTGDVFTPSTDFNLQDLIENLTVGVTFSI